jgi:proteasome lid subunit RPN8/RPN11
MPTHNAVSGRGGFAIPDHELRRVHLFVAESGLDCLAVYHSHPTGDARLSERDRFALAYSELPWVIITIEPPTRELRLTGYTRGDGHGFLVSWIETAVPLSTISV